VWVKVSVDATATWLLSPVGQLRIRCTDAYHNSITSQQCPSPHNLSLARRLALNPTTRPR
jgi:hypothetical protein